MQTIQTIQIEANLQWVVRQTQSGRWIAICEPLGLSMEGTTLDDLRESIGDSVQLLFTDLLVDDELEAFLHSRGWRMVSRAPQPNTDVRFDVPIDLLVHLNRDSARATIQ